MLFLASIDQGKVPSSWKKALTPIFKKGNRSSAANYRPVSLIPILSKSCKHILHCAIINHLLEHNVLTDAKHGFRKKRSCETQLLITIDDLAKVLDERVQSDLILLDFEKAFDKVSHHRLLLKPQHYGVRGSTLKWIADFLNNSTQQVVVDGQFSTEVEVTSGVPQGSVLGPLLFLIFINDLPDYIKNSTVRLFADDCVLYKSITSPEDSVKFQEDLNHLQEWEQQWMMKFHSLKCQVLRSTNKRNPLQSSYTINDHVLEKVESAKYLGVHIDSKLTFNAHINNIIKKANSTRAFLGRNFSNCSRRIKEATYTTFVRPTVEYVSPIWDPHTGKNIKRLEQVQRSCARYVTSDFKRESSVTAMIQNRQWQSLQSRRLLSRLHMMYGIRNDLVDINWKQHLTQVKPQQQTQLEVTAPDSNFAAAILTPTCSHSSPGQPKTGIFFQQTQLISCPSMHSNLHWGPCCSNHLQLFLSHPTVHILH